MREIATGAITQRAELWRAGAGVRVSHMLELPPRDRDGFAYLFRASDRAILWTTTTETTSLADSIVPVIIAFGPGA